MKYLLLLGIGIICSSLKAQSTEDVTFRTYSSDSATHYFLAVKKNPLLMIPNSFADVDTAAFKTHPMVKDLSKIVDSPELMDSEGPNNSHFQKFEFQKS